MPRRPIRDLGEYLDYVKGQGFAPGTVIDVGACYGTPELQDGFPDAWHILIEPLAEMEPRLQAILRRRHGEYYLLALADVAGEMPMQVPDGAPQGATLARPGDRRVRVETLDRLLGGRDLAGPILLKTDCQGFDLKVMKGAVGLLPRVDLVVMEVNMFHPAGNPALGDFGAIVAWMRDHGFAVHDILSYQTRPLDDALGYVDLAFVREDGAFRARHRWA